jgi:O-antigen ligase
MSIIATIVTLALIAGLFFLDREPGRLTSPALWVPTLWMAIISSRPISMWLHINREVSMADRYTEGSPLDAGFYAILIAIAVLTLNRRWPRVKQFLQSNLPVILFFLYCLLSVMWSDAPPIALKRWIKAIGDVMMVLVILTDANPRLAMKRIFTRCGFVLLPLSFLFIYGIPSIGTNYDPQSHVMYYTGVTTFKNLLGVTSLFCALGGLWSFLAALEDKSMPHRSRQMVAHALVFVMGLALIKRADSMTSFSCTLLAGGVMVAASTPWARRKPAAMFIAVSTAVGFSLFALFVAPVLLESLGRNSTLTGRTQIWAAVLAQKTNPFIGTGFESFWMGDRMLNVWSLSQNGIEESHNGYLELYVNLGWIGLVLLGCLIVTGFRNAMTLFRTDVHEGRLRLALFTAVLIFVNTEAGFRMMSPDWLAFIFSVMAVPPALKAVQTVLPQRVLHGDLSRRPVKILQ